MNKEDAENVIYSKLRVAQDIITECEKIADENMVSFNFMVAYGMGGTYFYRQAGWASSDCEIEGQSAGWVSSTSQC